MILEDEFLIAMDIEQICLDHGAVETHLVHQLEHLDRKFAERSRFDAAILDLRIGGQSTIPAARQLANRGIPFIFATGMDQHDEIATNFPGIGVVAKPYSGAELVASLNAALLRARGSRDGS